MCNYGTFEIKELFHHKNFLKSLFCGINFITFGFNSSVAGVNESIGEVHVLCEFPTMNFVWKAVEDEVWSYPRSCGEKLAIKAEQSLVFRGVSSSGSRFGRSTTVPPYEYDGGASSRIEANLIFTFVISVLSLWLGR